MNDFYKNIITLKSKLAHPRIDVTMQRHRLNALMQDIHHYKLVSITAGAGYGKTTLAAQACQWLGVKTVWYRLDASDNDAITWIHYLIAGIRQYFESFGTITLERIQSTQKLNAELRSLWTVFLHEIEQSIDEPLIIVLDDFHLVQGNEEVKSTISFLLEYLPEGVHLVLIGRTALDINLSTLIVRREAVVIREKDLTFTADEISELYHQIFQLPLSDKELEILEKKTNGWAAGLVLFHFSIHSQKGIEVEKQLDFLTGTEILFEEYIEENIFKLLPLETVAFLIKTSILPHLEVKLCNQLLEIDNADEILQQLENRHLFTFSSESERHTYHYHNLFRDFLRSKLTASMNRVDQNQLYCKAAGLLQESNDSNEAIRCYIRAEKYETASKLLVKSGFGMIENGQINQVLMHCNNIPLYLLDKNQWLQYLIGVALNRQGKFHEAFESFERACKLFQCAQDQYGRGLCLTHLAGISNARGDFTKAEEILNEIQKNPPPTSEYSLETLANLIFMKIRIGDLQAADQYFDQAETIIASLGKTSLAAGIYFCYGFRFFESDDACSLFHYGRKAWNSASQFNQHKIMAISCTMISYAHFIQGEYDLCFNEALKGIRILEKLNAFGMGYAMCHIHAAWAMLGKDDFSAAAEHCNLSLKVCNEIQNDLTLSFIHATACYVQVKLGDLDKAEASILKAKEIIEDTELELEKDNFKLSLAWILLLKGRTDESAVLIQADPKRPSKSKIMQRWRDLVHARLIWQTGHLTAAKEKLGAVLEKLSADEKDFFLIDQQDWIIPLLVEIYADGQTQKQITTLLSYFKPEQLKVLQELSKNDAIHTRTASKSLLKALSRNNIDDLHIRCFGTFTLRRGDLEITSEKWVSAKAKTLFKYLALHSSFGFVSKDKLLEMLWPDQDPAFTTNRLHVALSTIRKVLEPELTKGEPSVYLHRKKSGYRLKLGKSGFVDVFLFEQLLADAQTAKNTKEKFKLYLSAEKLYRGQLFEDDPYSQWCIGPREAYQEKYIKLLVNIADHYLSAQMHTKCIEYLWRVLEIDDCAEDIYCRLMSLYHQIGNRFMVKKTYQKCKNKLEVELDCPLSDTTEQLYQCIVSG